MVDNGSSHRGQKAIDRLAEQFPNAIMVHTPVHASWLNQVYFSIIQRKALSPNDFTDLDMIEKRLARFEDRYGQGAASISDQSLGPSGAGPSKPTSWPSPPDLGPRTLRGGPP